MLNRILNKAATGDVKLHLYTNNKTPAEADVVGDYTESTATGYAAVTLTGSNWDTTTTAGTASYAQQTFTYTAAEAAIYGYYVTDSAGTTVMWAELFSDGYYAIPSGGGTVKVTPTISLD